MISRAAFFACVLAAVGATVGPASVTPADASMAPANASAAPAKASVTPAGDAVRYTFDGESPLADVSGHGHDLTPVSRHGGSFTTVAHDGGSALAFPPPCDDEPCPRIALRSATTTGLNPGRRPIRYGASVRLASDETTKGENVLQKGYSAMGSQYKLQIDGAQGRPSCVLVGSLNPTIHVAVSPVSVADDRWHTLECRRAGTRLTIVVDDRVRAVTTIPADLSVRNAMPFSVGGKGSYSDNDQFQGVLDEVWVSID
jgi:hypothetical protein